jgi:cyclase
MRTSIRPTHKNSTRLALGVASGVLALWMMLPRPIVGQTQQQSQSFDIVPVANGVYGAIGKNGVFGNGAFIITQQGVLVVDTQARPSWAHDLIKEIAKLTDKPVRYVVNTHWHGDHTLGNQAYLQEFGAGVEFISQMNTREDLVNKGIPSLETQRTKTVPDNIAALTKQLVDGKDAQGAALNEATRAQLETQLKSQESNLEELKGAHVIPSTLTYDSTMVLHLGDREILLLHWGNAHTRGDTVVYLPKEKVVVTGDLLTNGIPVMRNAYPVEWIGTLDAIDKLDWTAAIPGHGNVQQGKAQLEKLLSYMKDMVAAVRDAAAKGATMEQAEKSIDLTKYKPDFPNFDAGSKAAIDRTWNQLTGKPME